MGTFRGSADPSNHSTAAIVDSLVREQSALLADTKKGAPLSAPRTAAFDVSSVQALRFRRPNNVARPNPLPTNSIVAGSGTGESPTRTVRVSPDGNSYP